MNEKTYQLLEFDKVLTQLARYTNFSAGEKLARNLRPTIHQPEAERWQRETQEAYRLLTAGSDVTIGGARDVRTAVDRAQRGITLLADELLDTRNTLIAARNLKRKIEKVAERYPTLAELAELTEEVPGLVATIGDTLDDRGDVLDSASTHLANIRRDLRIAHGRIQDKLQQIMSQRSAYLQESLISLRNGRYVLPVRSESRSNVQGIIHDQSGSGATVWVEPLATVELNNDYRRLQLEEEQEIQRILAALSAKVADQGDIIIRIVERMADFDLIFARARYASDLNAIPPEFVSWRNQTKAQQKQNLHPGSTIWLRGARHPLLPQDIVVPIDVPLSEDVFLVLITGPNTGGKTVSLKTIGLMVLMAQSGLHLPAHDAKLSLFDNVFADIGDEQSIEQSLSTFSGHLTNIIRILAGLDDRSLVLLDELGSGTDPAEGAALAQSIIDYLRDKGATSFVATHYPELKAYATRTAGSTNASLLFDIETLSPTYEMTIGIPGKSNALAIARRLGLDETILDAALGLLGAGSSETETLLDSIYDMREKIASEEAAIRLNRKRIEREHLQLERKLLEIEAERDRILAEARAEAHTELEAIRAEITQVRRKVRDAQSLNQMKQLSKNVDGIETQPRTGFRAEPLVRPAEQASSGPRPRMLKVGDTVRIKSLGMQGEVLSIKKDEAEVAIGRLHTRVELKELEFKGRPVQNAEPEFVAGSSSTSGTTHSNYMGESPGIELDLRGQRVDEGLMSLDKYMDSAVLARLPWVRIIHGKGTGRMRTAVRTALDKHTAVLRWEEAQDGEGGSGVTIARFEEIE